MTIKWYLDDIWDTRREPKTQADETTNQPKQ